MKLRWLTIPLLILVFLSGVTQGQAREGSGTQTRIDLQMTAALVERWATRSSFPESVTFAYYHIYMARALGLRITPERRKLISTYIASRQQLNGSFTPAVHAKTGSVTYTYYALAALDLLDETKAIKRKAATDFLLSRVQSDGGISATEKANDQATLATTYSGIESLRLLGALSSLDTAKTTSFVQRYRENGRGFAPMEGGPSTPLSTAMGLHLLKNLGSLTNEVEKEIVDYLKDTRYSGLIHDRKYQSLPEMKEMAGTLDALATLSALQEVNSGKIYDFIGSLYVAENGGFGPRPGLGTTPPSTYYAIFSLVRLGKLPDPMARNQDAQPSVSP